MWLIDLINRLFGRTSKPETTTLYRAVGEKELAWIEQAGYRRIPDFPAHSICTVLCDRECGEIGAHSMTGWPGMNGKGYLVKLDVQAKFLAGRSTCPVAVGKEWREYWIAMPEMKAFNDALVGNPPIELLMEYRAD